VVIPPAASPSNFEKRFTCNGVLSTGSSHKDNLDALLSSFDGKLSYTGGQWKIRASVWEASSVSFDEDDLAGAVDVRGSSPLSERFNTVRGVFVDPDRDYEVNEFPHVTNSTYVTRDNGVTLTYDLKLPMTNAVYMAQRIGFRLLNQANNQVVVKSKYNARGSKCATGDVVSQTIDELSWSAKTFRAIEWQRNNDSSFDITLREDSSASYDDPIVTDYITGNGASVTLPSEVVPPPTNFAASSVPYAIRLNWTNPATQEFDYIDIYASVDSAWSNAAKIGSVRTDTYTHNLGAGTTRYYWIRARRNNGQVSTRIPDSDTSTVTSTSGAGTDSVNLTGDTLSDEQVAAVTQVAYRLTSGGEEESYQGVPGSPTVWDTVSTWLIDGTAGNYACRLTKSSGTDPTSGNLNTLEVLSTTREWVWTDSTQDDTPVTFTGTIELLDVSQSPAPVLASASISVTIDSQSPAIGLSGSTGSPNNVNDFAIDPANATAGWYFNADGTVDRFSNPTFTQFNASTEWLPGGPGSPINYVIRATNNSGSNPNLGDSLNTWLALTSDRSWRWTATSPGTYSGSVKIEIADGASPQNILATGYYGGSATVSP
jgi:Putative phage tail protein